MPLHPGVTQSCSLSRHSLPQIPADNCLGNLWQRLMCVCVLEMSSSSISTVLRAGARGQAGTALSPVSGDMGTVMGTAQRHRVPRAPRPGAAGLAATGLGSSPSAHPSLCLSFPIGAAGKELRGGKVMGQVPGGDMSESETPAWPVGAPDECFSAFYVKFWYVRNQ